MKRDFDQVKCNVYDFQSIPQKTRRDVPGIQMDLGTIPMYEKADIQPASATALNKATDSDLKLEFQSKEIIYKIDEEALRYNTSAAAFSGARLVRNTDLPTFMMRSKRSSSKYVIPHAHYLNVQSEAKRGLHGLDNVVRSTFGKQKVSTTGADNQVKAYGFDRNTNRAIYPRLPDGLPMSVEPMRAVSDGIRINRTVVDPIAVFPSVGF
jgi:hypothetical protein